MSTSFRIDQDHGALIARGAGTLERGEIAAAVEAHSSHPDYRPEMNILWDLRDARFLIEFEEIKELTEHLSTLRTREAPHRVAFVVGDELTQMLTRMFPRVGPEHVVDYRTFDDLGEALDWLGLPPGYEPWPPGPPG